MWVHRSGRSVRMFAGSLGLIASCAALAQDQAVEITVVADQIRSQGFACTNPTSAERDATSSAPEEPVYVLVCENASYRVRIIPDQAAEVTEIK